ncbi:23688_t:CDS:2, partial [Gigaspora margarita]
MSASSNMWWEDHNNQGFQEQLQFWRVGTASGARTSSKIPRAFPHLISRSTTPTVSRPVTPSISETINVLINYIEPDDQEEKIAYSIFNSAKVIQWAWRTFKLRPETWVKQVWNMVRNDDTPNEKKFLDINIHVKKLLVIIQQLKAIRRKISYMND